MSAAMPQSGHRRSACGKGKRSDSLSRSLTRRRMPNDPPARRSAHYGRKAPTANAFLIRKGAFAGKGAAMPGWAAAPRSDRAEPGLSE